MPNGARAERHPLTRVIGARPCGHWGQTPHNRIIYTVYVRNPRRGIVMWCLTLSDPIFPLFSVAVAMEAVRNDPKETKRLDPRFLCSFIDVRTKS